MKRRSFFVIFCAIFGYRPTKELELATIYPSTIMPGPDNNVNCLSIFHNRRIDSSVVGNKRLMSIINDEFGRV